jgi:hypothetical protein
MRVFDGITIYLVMGSTGEYDDWREWIVCAYKDKERAKEHSKLAEEKADFLFQTKSYRDAREPAGQNEFDPRMDMDHTGTEYRIQPTRLIEEAL